MADEWGRTNVSGLYQGKEPTTVILLATNGKHSFQYRHSLKRCENPNQIEYEMGLLKRKLNDWVALLPGLEGILTLASQQRFTMYYVPSTELFFYVKQPDADIWQLDISMQKVTDKGDLVWSYTCSQHQKEPDLIGGGKVSLSVYNLLDYLDSDGISFVAQPIIAAESVNAIRNPPQPIPQCVIDYVSALPPFKDPTEVLKEAMFPIMGRLQ